MIKKYCKCGCGIIINMDKSFVRGHWRRIKLNSNLIIKEYLIKEKSQEQIAKELGVSQWVISQRLQENKTPIRKKTCKLDPRKYKVNMSFFDNITVDNAWVLGWLLSDGFINKSNNSHAFGIKINKRDKDILLKIKKLIGYNGKILTVKTFLKKTNKYYEHLLLKISSKSLVRRLEELGIYEGKSNKERFIKVIKNSNNEEIIKSFIKGIFEGDGSIIYTKKSLLFQIVGTNELLLDIQHFLIKYLNLNKTKLTCNIKNKNHRALRYRGNNQALKILDWLYSNNGLNLNRKYKKYLKVKKILEK